MGVLNAEPIHLILNPEPVRSHAYREEGRGDILSLDGLARAKAEITRWPAYRQTPLVALPGLAQQISIANILFKDEGARFNLGSFKALGGAYAVLRLLQKEMAKTGIAVPSGRDIASGKCKQAVPRITVTCATDGNHGKSVAWGAQKFGCHCVIFVHAGVSAARRDAIASYGAKVRVVDGTYDEAVRFASAEALRRGWHVVSDTSYGGYQDIPRDVMQGYALIAQEICDQLQPEVFPTHIFVQGGVGGLAAAICAYFWERFGAGAPSVIVCEPDRANCLQLSAKAGRPVTVHGALDTIMAGLACGEVSLLAWQILASGADAFASITDDAAARTMCVLAKPPFGDLPIVAGESAVAGLASLLLIGDDAACRHAIGLDADSVALVIGTEGATDPAMYRRIVGIDAEQVIG